MAGCLDSLLRGNTRTNRSRERTVGQKRAIDKHARHQSVVCTAIGTVLHESTCECVRTPQVASGGRWWVQEITAAKAVSGALRAPPRPDRVAQVTILSTVDTCQRIFFIILRRPECLGRCGIRLKFIASFEFLRRDRVSTI